MALAQKIMDRLLDLSTQLNTSDFASDSWGGLDLSNNNSSAGRSTHNLLNTSATTPGNSEKVHRKGSLVGPGATDISKFGINGMENSVSVREERWLFVPFSFILLLIRLNFHFCK